MYFFIYYCVALLPMSPVLMRSLSRSHLHTHTTTETIWLVFILLLLSFFFAVNTAASSLLSLSTCLFRTLVSQCLRVWTLIRDCECVFVRVLVCVRLFVGIFIWIFPPPPHYRVITQKNCDRARSLETTGADVPGLAHCLFDIMALILVKIFKYVYTLSTHVFVIFFPHHF